jgi:hypothetical protein
MRLKNSIRKLVIATLALFLAVVGAENMSAQSPGYLVSDYSLDVLGMGVFNVDGSNGYNVFPSLDPPLPPSFSGSCRLKEPVLFLAIRPSAPRDGSVIAFQSPVLKRVMLMNRDGSGVQPVTLPDPTFPDAPDTAPVISPDGTKIAFISRRADGNTQQIFTVNRDGSGLTQVTLESASVRNAVAWSPDSTQLAFARSPSATCAPSFDTLNVINADGTGEQLLLCKTTVFDTSIDWSPDGTRIAYSADFPGPGIGQVRPDGTPLESLAPNQLGGLNTTEAGAFRYSPDSTRLAYANGVTGFRGVSFINVNGTGRQDAINDGSFHHIWWQPGPIILGLTTLTLGPDPLVVGPGFLQQLSPVLKDSAGNILSRSAYGYCTGDSRFAIANELGFVASPGNPYPFGTLLMEVMNGGLVSNAITVLPQPTDPPVSFYPAIFDFGNQAVATSSATQGFTLTNTGSLPLNVNAITLIGENGGDYALDSSSTCPLGGGGPLMPGDACTVGVILSPSDVGTRVAQINVDDDATGSPQTISLMGTGTALAASRARPRTHR